MRSKRTDRKELKSELAALRAALTAAEGQLAAIRGEEERTAEEQIADIPKIAACGYPLRTEPQPPKTLKEAKQLLMSLREW